MASGERPLYMRDFFVSEPEGWAVCVFWSGGPPNHQGRWGEGGDLGVKSKGGGCSLWGFVELAERTSRTPSAPVLYWDKDKSRVSSQGYAVVVVLVSKVNQLQVRRLEAE